MRAEINALDAQLPVSYSTKALCAFDIFVGGFDSQRKVFKDW